MGRVLVLTPRFPYPVIGGDRLRIHAICRALAREHSLTLLSLCDQRTELDHTPVEDNLFDSIHRVYLPRWRSLLQTAVALPTQTPLQIAYYRSAEFAHRLAALLPAHDLAIAHLIRTGDYLVGARSRPALLEMTDAISMNYARARAQRSPGLRGRVYALEQQRLHRYERSMPACFEAISLIAETDARHLWGAELPGNVVIASNGVDCTALPWSRRELNPPIAVLIGNMYSAQNMDACRYFVTEILPLVSPDAVAEFRVVGRIRDEDAAWLRSHRRVTVTGEIASIPNAVRDARLGVCPIRIGAGVQNKVLEYMALGLPVVATPVGHEGIAAEMGRDLLIGDTASSFAAQIERLSTEDALFRDLARHGRAFVESHHGWDASLEPLVARVRSLVATSPQSRKASSAPCAAQ